MALKQRERVLAWLACSVVSVAAVLFGYNYVQSLFDERQTQIEALGRELDDKNAIKVRGKKAQKKLVEWQHRSLPTDLVLARSLYTNWLAGLAERTRLAKADVTLGADMPKPGIYVKIPVTVRGQGTMEQVVQFLFDFYQADHLHYIRQLTLTPLATNDAGATPGGVPPAGGPVGAAARPGGFGGFAGRGGFGGPGGFGGIGRGGVRTDGPKYEVVLAVEALALPGGDRLDQLSEAKADRLAFKDVDAYRKTITERNFFSPYQPVIESDPAADTYVTAVVKDEGKLQVWINVRSTGKTLKLHEGETFDLGKEKATLTRIDPHSVEIETAGRRRVIMLGKSLAEERGRWGGFGRRGIPGATNFDGP
jgi:hypothetical protein